MKVIALLRMRDEKGVDDKVVCVPCEDPNLNHIDRLEDLPQQLRDEIAHFLSMYKQREGHDVRIEGWRPRQEALAVIEASQNRYRERDA